MLPKTKKVAQNLKTCKLCAGGIKTEDALQCIYWFLPNTCAQIATMLELPSSTTNSIWTLLHPSNASTAGRGFTKTK